MMSSNCKEAEYEDVPPAKRTRLSIRRNLQKFTRKSQKRIWLPAECWVDTLKLLSRRQLLRGVQPACRRLHAIAELPDVHSLHIVRHFGRFLDAFAHNRREAKRQCVELAASQTGLARHFRLGANVDFRMDQRNNKRRLQAQKFVLGHSLELFGGCQLQLNLNHKTEHASEFLAYLSMLAPARPFSIEIAHDTKSRRELQDMPSAESICHWLHHLPNAEEGKVDQNSIQQTRMFSLVTEILPSRAADIIEYCKQSLQQAESVSDRRSFLLTFELDDSNSRIQLFKLENRASGEVLQLEEHQLADMIPSDVFVFYRLRRCTAVELANADQFYRDTFWDIQKPYFQTPLMDNGLEAPILELRFGKWKQ